MKTPRQRVDKSKEYMLRHGLGNPDPMDISLLMLSELHSLNTKMMVFLGASGVMVALLIAHIVG